MLSHVQGVTLDVSQAGFPVFRRDQIGNVQLVDDLIGGIKSHDVSELGVHIAEKAILNDVDTGQRLFDQCFKFVVQGTLLAAT